MKTIKNIRPANKIYQILNIIYLLYNNNTDLLKYYCVYKVPLYFTNCFPAKKNNVVVKFYYSYDCKMEK